MKHNFDKVNSDQKLRENYLAKNEEVIKIDLDKCRSLAKELKIGSIPMLMSFKFPKDQAPSKSWGLGALIR